MNYNKEDFKDIEKIIKSGGVIIIPTDTVYGLACDALNEEAVKKIYNLKDRNLNNPMNIIVSDIDMMKKYVSSLSEREEEIVKNYMPGPLTIILKKNNVIPDIVTAGLDTIRS